jgi:hypothetical protein
MITKSKEQRRQVCFEVDDLEEKSRLDPELITRLETTFPLLGVFTMHINVALNLYCVLIEAPDVQVENLLDVFSQLGCNARMKGDVREYP